MLPGMFFSCENHPFCDHSRKQILRSNALCIKNFKHGKTNDVFDLLVTYGNKPKRKVVKAKVVVTEILKRGNTRKLL